MWFIMHIGGLGKMVIARVTGIWVEQLAVGIPSTSKQIKKKQKKKTVNKTKNNNKKQ